jgi:bifunctional UDP-N-acetylglucosamine pyrophosphorylase/glucosamine-1-phosphate N-acetyltransferase
LIRAQTLKELIAKHEHGRTPLTLATAVLEDATGYGRIARDAYGNIQGIVEESDCTDEQRAIREVNPSYYLFDGPVLLEALEEIRPDNVKGEYYLTDTIAVLLSKGHRVEAVTAVRPEEAVGVNSRGELSEAGKIMQGRIQRELMDNGVTIVDPSTTWIDARAEVGRDTVIEPFTYIHGAARIGKGARVGPFAYLEGESVVSDGSEARPGTGLWQERAKLD